MGYFPLLLFYPLQLVQLESAPPYCDGEMFDLLLLLLLSSVGACCSSAVVHLGSWLQEVAWDKEEQEEEEKERRRRRGGGGEEEEEEESKTSRQRKEEILKSRQYNAGPSIVLYH